jgi:hypothetical protein
MTPKLASPPADDRSRELWTQHAAGYIIFRDMRGYAVNNISDDTDEKTKEKIIKGIEDSIYGLMMMMDGVVGILQNDEYTIRIENNILLEKNGQIIQNINTLDGDGMCMGFHDWKEGNFGEDNVVQLS